MKKTCLILMMTLLLALTVIYGVPALAEAATAEAGQDVAEPDEWTVLFYFCGSDLESQYGYASGNLEDITQVHYPINYLPMVLKSDGIEPDDELLKKPGKVNVLAQTGGCSQWHARELGMDISSKALQRWRYDIYTPGEMGEMTPYDSFKLIDTLPLGSMADSQTLSDFIRWGVETCPAKKYALVLWDHGDGARTGLLIDELYDGDVMYLYELRQALADAGTRFESVIIDACLMANIETAWNLKDWANWLVASEEVVPGKGTAVSDWLQALMYYPECDGEWLGRCVCDTTSVKYANDTDEESRARMTWSVIDLSQIDRLIDVAGRFFQEMGWMMRNDPKMAALYMRAIFNAEEYGDGMQNMRDIGAVACNEDLAMYARRSLRNETLQALKDAVVYCVCGQGRRKAKGLSFCYPADFDDDELDHYALNFPMPWYLAYIDSVSNWRAPEWVYESAEELPDLEDIEVMRIRTRRAKAVNGMPGLVFEMGNSSSNVAEVRYYLYRLNEDSGELVRLGNTDCVLESMNNDSFDLIWHASDPMHWPAIDGELICMDLVETQGSRKLYNVPVMIDEKNCMLRCGRHVNYADDEDDRINEYEIYGVWEGYDADSQLLSRSVKPLSALAGQEYRLQYPIDDPEGDDRAYYESSPPLKMYRALNVEEIALPAGTYFMEYRVTDVFMRTSATDRIEILWDGENMTFPGIEDWESDWMDVGMLRTE